MIKEIGLATITVLSLLGCGSEGSSGMKDKKFIHILQDIQPEMCNNDQIAQALSLLPMHEYKIEKTNNDTTCEDYDKIDDGFFCTIESIGGGTSNCVVGFENRPEDFTGFASEVLLLEDDL